MNVRWNGEELEVTYKVTSAQYQHYDSTFRIGLAEAFLLQEVLKVRLPVLVREKYGDKEKA